MDANTTGAENTAIGAFALDNNSTASNNTAVGCEALEKNTTGEQNTAVGFRTLEEATTADNNTAIGAYAGDDITTGHQNTLVGHDAGGNLTTGHNNVCLGYATNLPANNSTDTIVLGNSSIQHLRCQRSSIEGLSDERDKTDIVDLAEGLDLINTLKPRKFTWAMREESSNNGKTDIGFIAQELDTAFGTSNDYVRIVSKEDPEKLAVAQGQLIPILVNAVKELSAKNDALEARIKTLEG